MSVYTASTGTHIAWNKNGVFQSDSPITTVRSGFALADLENRGTLDLIAGPTVFRNDRKGGFTKRESPLPIDCPSWTAADLDNDGRIDLACGTKQFLNRTVSGNNWIGVNLTGVKNIKSGARSRSRDEGGIRAIRRSSTRVAANCSGSARRSMADTVRITWPNGLIQNEIKQAGRQDLQIRRGAAAVRIMPDHLDLERPRVRIHHGRPGSRSARRKFRRRQVLPRRSRRVRPDLRQVSRARRWRIPDSNHRGAQRSRLHRSPEADRGRPPSDMSVYTNDKFKGPPFPEFRLYGVRNRTYAKCGQNLRRQKCARSY